MTVTAATANAIDDKLVGAVAIVTGASNGIGAAVARALVAAGASVVGVDREGSTVAGVAGVRCDLADASATGSVIDDVVSAHGRLDFLVNNAGLARHAAIADINLGELDLMWAVNVRAVIQLTRDAMRVMSARGGRIVNVVSTAGLAGQAGESAYCATKFAVRGFTEAAAEEGRLSGVRVTGVYPAGVNTGFWDDAVGDRPGFTADKAWLTPDQVATQIVSVLRTPLDIDVPTLVIRHPGDVDLAGMAAKLDRIRRA